MNKIFCNYKILVYSFCLISLLVQNILETSSLGIISSTNELIEIIDAGQKENAFLISPMKGVFTRRYVETPAGQQRNYEQLKALGEDPNEGPFINDVIRKFSSFIVFDGQKIKYGTEDCKYLFNGLGVPSGTLLWDELTDIIYPVGTYSSDNMIPLTGEILPELKDFGIDFLPNDANCIMILVCFFDYEQRPSRNCILELNKKAKELNKKDIEIVAVQASKVEHEYLDKWLNENNISFPIGMINENVEQTHSNWGVKALPWLILTDKEHIVKAEGFSISVLDEKIKDIENVEQ